MVRISAVQMPVADSLEDNLAKITPYMEAARGSDIVCFPETSLTGESRLPYTEVEAAVKSVGDRARSLGMWSIVGGYARRGNKIFNELYVVNRDGDLAYTYRKKHLWKDEKGITPGKTNRVVATDFGTIGVINCWDIRYPLETLRLAQEGADMVFCPAYWYKKYGTSEALGAMAHAAAFQNQIYFVLCDAYSEETAAESRIWSPLGTLAKAERKECIISADINLTDLKELRKTFDCYPGKSQK
ncbi:MAG: carbon-nitrogen hydrolase family protein [Candidatus Aenigmarchaeota archaeon]|nr:carbon-nitrogen hydrolase family protein [Candidatus Aenigmarchaeota archaeon]